MAGTWENAMHLPSYFAFYTFFTFFCLAVYLRLFVCRIACNRPQQSAISFNRLQREIAESFPFTSRLISARDEKFAG